MRINRPFSQLTHAFAKVSWRQKTVRVIAVAALVLCTGGYVGLTNNVATQGYRLSELQRELDTAKQQSAVLELDITAARSLPRLESEAGAISMIPVQRIEYLATSGTQVALR